LPCAQRRAVAGQAPKDRSRHEAGAAGVVVVEETTNQLTRCEEARNRPHLRVQNLTLLVDVQPSEGEGDPARHGVALVGWLVDWHRPVGLRRVDALRALAVQN